MGIYQEGCQEEVRVLPLAEPPHWLRFQVAGKVSVEDEGTDFEYTVWLESPGLLLHSQEQTEWKHPRTQGHQEHCGSGETGNRHLENRSQEQKSAN